MKQINPWSLLKGLSPEPGAAMLCHLPLQPRPHGSLATQLGLLRTLWPAPGTLLAELEQELLQELETAREFASSRGRLMASEGSSSPAGKAGQSCGQAVAQGPAQLFAVRQDIQGFVPEELRLKLVGRKLLLTGRKETQREDGQSAFYKYEVLRREWDMPAGVDTDRLACSISREGQLHIEAPGLPPAAAPERNVPIQLSPAGSSVAPAELGSEDGTNGRDRG